MSLHNKIIIISGPTATGKTSTSLKIANYLASRSIPAAIVNFDSLLFYRELNIGTAKPTPAEQQQCEHHLIDITSVATPLNASDYVKFAQEKINSLHHNKKIVILVGGSGFYLRALIKGMYQGPQTDENLRESLEQQYKNNGIEPLRDILKKEDPLSYQSLHPNDHYRIIRAVEYLKSTQTPISNQKKEMDKLDPYDLSKPANNNWDLFHCYLDIPKEQHYSIIQTRTKNMFAEGLLEEVKKLLQSGFTGTEKPLQSIGYKETIGFLNNKFATLDECIERISISTRQLAKSQRTWFQKVKEKKCYNPLVDNILDDILLFLNAQP